MEKDNDMEENTTGTNDSQKGTMPTAAALKKKRRTPMIIGIVAMILILSGTAAFFVWKLSEERRSEAQAYAILEGNYNTNDYEAFLADFPESEHSVEVQKRLADLRIMLGTWKNICNSSHVADFSDFRKRFPGSPFDRLCDIKIDSLDWTTALRTGTQESFALYLSQHPEGRYASEASVAQGKMRDMEITPEDRDLLMQVCTNFFRGFESQDEATVCSNIVPTMRRFLHKENATKADVVNIIKGMFNEHILSCSFIVNRDFDIVKVPEPEGRNLYRATFSVDQHIERDNEGKTFGSYRAVVDLNDQLLIEALTLEEVSEK